MTFPLPPGVGNPSCRTPVPTCAPDPRRLGRWPAAWRRRAPSAGRLPAGLASPALGRQCHRRCRWARPPAPRRARRRLLKTGRAPGLAEERTRKSEQEGAGRTPKPPGERGRRARLRASHQPCALGPANGRRGMAAAAVEAPRAAPSPLSAPASARTPRRPTLPSIRTPLPAP